MACGTGACASAVAAIRTGKCDKELEIELLGGRLKIAYDAEGDGHVFMTGPATEVFAGDIRIPSDYEKDDVKIYQI